MHTITDCPRCGKDFMYHHMDVHLNREVLVGSNGYEHLEAITICQDCNEVEPVANFIEWKAGSRGWENAEHMANFKFGETITKKAMKYLYETGN